MIPPRVASDAESKIVAQPLSKEFMGWDDQFNKAAAEIERSLERLESASLDQF